MIDNDPLLLQQIDFSDPLLSSVNGRLSESSARRIITRSQRRLRRISIWNHHYGDIQSLNTIWSLQALLNTIVTPPLLLQNVILAGHQDLRRIIVAIKFLQKSSSTNKCIKLATCTCATKSVMLILNRYNVRLFDIELKVTTLNHEGWTICNECNGRGMNYGWFVACPKCHRIFCGFCTSRWPWSNELSATTKCTCNYCQLRDQQLHGISIVTSTAVAPSTSLPHTNTNTNECINNVNSSTLHCNGEGNMTMTPPLRWSCRVHCRDCC
jgi:hypothetical protein